MRMPQGLSAMGVERARLPDLAAKAVEDPTAAANPVPLTREAALALYEDAM
jgi:alcohol dehydrogenase class IV